MTLSSLHSAEPFNTQPHYHIMATRRRNSSTRFEYQATGAILAGFVSDKKFEPFLSEGILYLESRYAFDKEDLNKKHTVSVDPDVNPARLVEASEALKLVPKVDTKGIVRFFESIIEMHTSADVKSGAYKPKGLADLSLALRVLIKHAKHPWLKTKASGVRNRGVMYAPLSVEEAARSYSRGDEQPYVELTLGYNIHSRFGKREVGLRPDPTTLRNFTVIQHLAEAGFQLATDADMAEYKTLHERYLKYVDMNKEQVWVRGWHPSCGGRYWWAHDDVTLTVRGEPSKAILELSYIKKDEDDDSTSKSKAVSHVAEHPIFFDSVVHAKLPLPTHPVLKVFSLLHHDLYWVNVADMKEYEYDAEVQDKLVLPLSHTKLLDALVTDLDTLAGTDEEDTPSSKRSRIFQSKAQSKIILLKGPPGVGKTLTAEVYAERIKRPLYEVACGQLGADPEAMETNLAAILARSYALQAPLLLNEADVFIRRRGDDFDQNAIITVFLRLLEYHEGLVFLTTNRGDDVDDALLSRCIAIIQCNPPETVELRAQLWSVLTHEFGKQMPSAMCIKAAKLFPKAVGRDIQNLLQLVRRVCKAHGEPVTLQALADYAVFRGIHVETSVLEK